MKTLTERITLIYRIAGLCLYLKDQGIGCKINKYLRKRKTAHRWSTAHHIVSGKIPIGALRSLEGGKDLDGNLWYEPLWDKGGDNSLSASSFEDIRANAISLGAPNTEFAHEGYEPDDPARLPNIRDIPISKHVLGLAVDVLIDWNSLGEPWGDRANKVIAEFGLARPVPNEFWHFEVDPAKRSAARPQKLIYWALKGILTHPHKGK